MRGRLALPRATKKNKTFIKKKKESILWYISTDTNKYNLLQSKMMINNNLVTWFQGCRE